MNVREQNLRVRDVEYGWGADETAYEFTPEMAEYGLTLQEKVVEQYPNPMFKDAMLDVLANHKKGEVTYFLSWMWHYLVHEIETLETK